MKKFEQLLEKVMGEETKGSRLQIPLSLIEKIGVYQKAWKDTGRGKISREDVIIRMMLHGSVGLNEDRKELVKMQIEKMKTNL